MDSQTSFLPEVKPLDSCYSCRHFSALKEPRKSEEEWVIYGYCFKDGMRIHSPNMGKGYPIYIEGGKCKEWKKLKRSGPPMGAQLEVSMQIENIIKLFKETESGDFVLLSESIKSQVVSALEKQIEVKSDTAQQHLQKGRMKE